MHGSLEHAQTCLKRGAVPDAPRGQSPGRSALHKAAFWGHDHIVPWLLTLKVPVNAVDYNGDTALHDAARFGHDKCIDALLGAAGVDVSVVNKEGKTAHDVAVENGKKPRAGSAPAAAASSPERGGARSMRDGESGERTGACLSSRIMSE